VTSCERPEYEERTHQQNDPLRPLGARRRRPGFRPQCAHRDATDATCQPWMSVDHSSNSRGEDVEALDENHVLLRSVIEPAAVLGSGRCRRVDESVADSLRGVFRPIKVLARHHMRTGGPSNSPLLLTRRGQQHPSPVSGSTICTSVGGTGLPTSRDGRPSARSCRGSARFPTAVALIAIEPSVARPSATIR